MKQTKMKTMMPWATILASLLLLLSLGAARAQQAVVPGRSVGRVFLGMPRGDVWKILQPPHQSRSLPASALPAPHLPGRYMVDQWEGSSSALTILYRNAKVVQVEANSAQFAAPGGVSVATPFAVLRRRFPRMRVDQYLFAGGVEAEDDNVLFYADDVRRGIAFTSGALDYDSTYDDLPRLKPDDLIVHLPGQRVLPADVNSGVRITVAPRGRGKDLPKMRAWFAGGPLQKITKGSR